MEDDLEENSISKSEAKRRMTALQKVGEELVGLSVESLKKFQLPENLLDALLDAKRINPNKHGGMSRQMQYIGKLMRTVDAAPIIEKLDTMKAPSQKQNALHHLAEQWRIRLLADISAVGAFKNEFMPDDDAASGEAFATLIAQARDEYLKQKPPKYFRMLYKDLLRRITTVAGTEA
ncbi:MAG: ribosome biogenesis factor YjgA [Pseudomonadota bacterium]